MQKSLQRYELKEFDAERFAANLAPFQKDGKGATPANPAGCRRYKGKRAGLHAAWSEEINS